MNLLIILSNYLLCEALREHLTRELTGCRIIAITDCCDVEDFVPDTIMADAHTLSQYLRPRWPEAKIVLLDTGLDVDQLTGLLLNFKLNGIIDTHTDIALFKKALHAIDAGQVWINYDRIKGIVDHVDSPAKTRRGDPLSREEQEIVVLVAQGLRNKDIAERLFISEQTVKVHLSRIFRKCHVSRRSQLATIAMRFRLRTLL
jgi:DNA-binding NarL/FixJ family response regulator